MLTYGSKRESLREEVVLKERIVLSKLTKTVLKV